MKSVDVIRVPGWAKHPWLIHGFSTRGGGRSTVYRQGKADLNLGFTNSDDAKNVTANRKLFLTAAAQGKPIKGMVTARQIHSSLIRRVSAADVSDPAKGDGLMTDDRGVLLGIQSADCLPILVADRKKRVVAAFHAGWRGTLARIAEAGVGRMRLEFGSQPGDLIAAIGPGIGRCCYSVGEEVRDQFHSQFAYAEELFCEVHEPDAVKEKYPLLFLTARAPGHAELGPSLHLDLAQANRRQLLAAGLEDRAISLMNLCTGCHPERFFSHRMERGFTGRMMSVIGVAKPAA